MSKRKHDVVAVDNSPRAIRKLDEKQSPSNSKKFVCNLNGCKQSFATQQRLLCHQTTTLKHNPIRQFACDFPGCNKSYTTERMLQYHQDTIHINPNAKIPCKTCGKTFGHESKLKIHIANVHTKRPRNFKCLQCEMAFYSSDSLKTHVDNVHLKLKPHKCSICGKNFGQEHHLTQHMVMHTSERLPCRCDSKCTRTFSNIYARDDHERAKHTGETPYLCDVAQCHERFCTRRQLRAHKLEHAKLPYPCSQCDVFCKSKLALANHMNQHTGAKPFPCSYTGCSEAFKNPGDRHYHETKIHSGKQFRCEFPGCSKVCLTKQDWNAHKKVHAKGQSYISRAKVAEDRIEKVLNDAGIVFERERNISYSCIDEIGNHKRARVDFIISTEKAVVLLEVDESAHKQNDLFCEIARMSRTQAAIVLGSIGANGTENVHPTLWIRYNPNPHRLDGVKHTAKAVNSSGLTYREAALLDVIANPNLGDRSAGILYMYYDSKTETNADGSTTIVPLVVDSPDYVAFMREMVLPAIA